MSDSIPFLSVVVCTRNPRVDFLTRALKGLADQTLSQERWELVLVDNGSTDPLAGRVDLSFHPGARVVREEQTGLAHARVRGLRETSGETLIYVDDDNVLDCDYLAGVQEISRQWPMIGAWGGQTIPEWEEMPEEWTREYWQLLAVREFTRDSWANAPAEGASIPFGAGLCVRRHVAEVHARTLAEDPLRGLFGRSGGGLLGGEDYDLALTSRDLGLGTGLFSRLKLTHIIPRQRVQEEYLLRIVEALTHSGLLLDFVRGKTPFVPSRSERLLRFYQRLFISERARRFEQARLRGFNAALRDIARIREGNQYKPTTPDHAAARIAVAANDPGPLVLAVPVFNGERFLAETLSSLNANGPRLRWWLQDGASTDRTVEIARSFARPGNTVVTEPDQGQTDAINRAMARMGGEIIGFINADDCLLPDTAERVLAFFAANPEIDLICGGVEWIDESSTSTGRHVGRIESLEEVLDIYGVWWRERQWVQPEVFYRRSLFERVGRFDTRYQLAFDYDFWVRCFLAGARVAHVPYIFARFRRHPAQKSTAAERAADEIRAILQRHLPNAPIRTWKRRALYAQLSYDAYQSGRRPGPRKPMMFELLRNPEWLLAPQVRARLQTACSRRILGAEDSPR